MDIDAVEQRPRDARAVALDHQWRACAFVLAVGVETAWARVHRGDEHHAGRKGHGAHHTRDGDAIVLQRLAQNLDYVLAELGKLVEEEHPVVGKADLAGARHRAAAD